MVDCVTPAEVELVQSICTSMCSICSAVDREALERYLAATRDLVDGTLDVLLPHSLSISDMRKAQHNLTFIRSVAGKVLEIQDLHQQQLAHENASTARAAR